MPLRKQGTIVPAAAIAIALAVAAVPATASAYTYGSNPVTSTATSTATTATSTASTSTTSSTTTSAGCTPMSTTKSFSKFGDNADYFMAPGGNFENGAPGWKFSGNARVVSGNESLGVTGGSKAMQLGVGGTATSPAFCVDDSLPSFRFASKLSSLDGGYAAIVIYRNAAGKITQGQFTSSAAGTYYNNAAVWNPSAISPLADKIPLTDANATASVQLMFVGTTKAYGMFVAATSTIDSVMVDPYRRG